MIIKMHRTRGLDGIVNMKLEVTRAIYRIFFASVVAAQIYGVLAHFSLRDIEISLDENSVDD